MNTTQTLKALLFGTGLLSLAAAHAASTGMADRAAPSGQDPKALAAQARSVYAADMKRCAQLGGNERAVCVKEAQAVQAEALAAARRGRQVGDEVKANGAEQTPADYEQALRQCETLAGDAKSACIAAVNAQFGKY